MTTFEYLVLGLLGADFLVVIWLVTEVNGLKKSLAEKQPVTKDSETVRLQLQAYERLALLCERISLNNLITRFSSNGISAIEMKASLIDAIKSEFEYNITQQVYVSDDAWKAVTNLKEQNIYTINQLATNLPQQANGMDLTKHMVDFLMNNQKTNLNTIVSEILNSEAKKIM